PLDADIARAYEALRVLAAALDVPQLHAGGDPGHGRRGQSRRRRPFSLLCHEGCALLLQVPVLLSVSADQFLQLSVLYMLLDLVYAADGHLTALAALLQKFPCLLAHTSTSPFLPYLLFFVSTAPVPPAPQPRAGPGPSYRQYGLKCVFLYSADLCPLTP